MKTFLRLLFVVWLALSLAGCEQRQTAKAEAKTRSLAEIDATVSRLENEVRGLERALAEMEASRGKWVLWRTVEFPTVSGGVLPPKPFSGFPTKHECATAAGEEVVEVLKRGEGQALSEISYLMSYREFNGSVSTAKVIFRCLPDTVDAGKPTK